MLWTDYFQCIHCTILTGVCIEHGLIVSTMLVIGLFCASLSALLYLNTLSGELVFDDRASIVENKDLQPSSSWTNLLWHDFWINYHLHQLSVTGYHVINVLLNAGVCYLYVQLCARVFGGKIWSSSLAVAVNEVIIIVQGALYCGQYAVTEL